MGELVRDEAAALRGTRRVLSGAKDHMRPEGISTRADAAGRGGGVLIEVDADAGEVAAEARLHKETCLVVERLARGVERVLDGAGSFRLKARGGRIGFSVDLVFLFACGALALDLRARLRRGNVRVGSAHHLVGDTVGFVLLGIVCTVIASLHCTAWSRSVA